MSTKQPRAAGFQDIQELRLIILIFSGWRDTADLGLKFSPPTSTPTRRDGAAQGSP